MNHTIANLISDHLVTVLSHTLLHSLWQGALLSVLTGLIMILTRRASVATRYNLLVAALAMFAVAVAGTFMLELTEGRGGAPVSAGRHAVNTGIVRAGMTVDAAPSPALTATIDFYLNQYAATIVSVWFLIGFARCLKMAIGLHTVYALRRKDIFPMTRYWEERVAQLSIQLGIKRQTGIVESGRISTPMVIGHLKPLILIPLGILTSLSAKEAEAVLLHELAHVRRADYLVNLLQNLMEIVFFFNPAVLWLSALIKAERENCCDDIVLDRSSKVDYVKALVACQEFSKPSPAYAMALKGSNGGLKNRVARIISNKNKSLNGREKSLLAVCLLAVGIFAAAFATAPTQVRRDTTKPVTSSIRLGSDTDKTNSVIRDMLKDGIITSRDNLSFKIGTDEFVVNYKKQPEAVYRKYRAKYVGQQDGDRIWFFEFDMGKYAAMNGLPRPQPTIATPHSEAETDPKTDDKRTKNIIRDMLKDGIITSTNDLSFKIGTDEFVVNYHKQPEAVYQKYRAKYVATQYSGNEEWIWYYNFDTKTGVFQGKENQ